MDDTPDIFRRKPPRQSQQSGQRERRKPRKPTAERIKRWALAHVERFACTEGGLRQTLTRRATRAAKAHNVDMVDIEPMITAAVAFIVGLGYVNDKSFSEARAGRLSRAGKSERVIRRHLLDKGADEETTNAAIELVNTNAATPGFMDEDTIDPELCRAAALVRKKRLGNYGGKSDYKHDMSAMARAGFSYGIARDALAMSVDEIEDAIRRLL